MNKTYNILDLRYCVSSWLVHQISVISSYIAWPMTLYGKVLPSLKEYAGSKFSLDTMEEKWKFHQIIIPFALFWYETGYSQLRATRLIGYVPTPYPSRTYGMISNHFCVNNRSSSNRFREPEYRGRGCDRGWIACKGRRCQVANVVSVVGQCRLI